MSSFCTVLEYIYHLHGQIQKELLGSIEVNKDTAEWKSYLIDQIVEQRTLTNSNVEYLLCWEGKGLQRGRMVLIEALGNANDLGCEI